MAAATQPGGCALITDEEFNPQGEKIQHQPERSPVIYLNEQ